MHEKKIIAVTLGDPEGIGPEIISKSLSVSPPRCPTVVIGSSEAYPGPTPPVISSIDEVAREKEGIYFYNIPPGSVDTDLSYQYVKTGIRWALDKNVQALVTAPISKEKWLQAGIPHKGHTQLLAETAGVDNVSMFFWSRELKVALFTIHVPLQDIFASIKKDNIIAFVRFLSSQLTRFFSTRFTFLVSGLNPHSGEGGHLGEEEVKEIIPAVEELEKEMDIRGPYPPDTVFLPAGEKKNTVVICWYHDQGLIPFKLLNIHNGVNMTLGLPYIRTSPDHGTAFDIAGKGIANPSSMSEALGLAEILLQQEET
ncbi:MAG: 4-hydroxythreonine-4-phosphate dehydrogenase PdxA [bacterium]|nr:4-hydroxythreonine-4-phosphate dehydrogenase PdxA [bacterium]